MALMPRKVKYRKSQRGKNRGLAINGSRLHFGEYGLKSLQNGYVLSNHIEAARVIVARKTHGSGKFFINVFPHKSITKKPAETRKSSRSRFYVWLLLNYRSVLNLLHV